MISGFVIFLTATGNNFSSFVSSRISRLYPAFWFCCIATSLVTIFIGFGNYSVTWIQFLKNMTMVPNMLNAAPIDASYWTLSVELRFYFLISIILVMGIMDFSEFILVFWLIVSGFMFWHPVPLLCSFLITDYAPCFIAGAFFYKIWNCGLNIYRGSALTLCFAGVAYQIRQALITAQVNSSSLYDQHVGFIVSVSFFFIFFLISMRWTGPFRNKNYAVLGAMSVFVRPTHLV